MWLLLPPPPRQRSTNKDLGRDQNRKLLSLLMVQIVVGGTCDYVKKKRCYTFLHPYCGKKFREWNEVSQSYFVT